MLRFLPLATLTACATMNGARPLERGQHAFGATVGGGLMNLGAPIPIPNVVLEGRHGLPELAHRPFDLGYGLNATGLPFGLLAGHVGADWLLLPQARAWPALSLTDRVFFATNLLGLGSKIDPELEAWVTDQVEVTASWRVHGQLPYVSLSQYTDPATPALTLTPALGFVLDPKTTDRGLALQTELRWYGMSQPDEADTVTWVPGDLGVLGVTLGLSGTFDPHREERP